MTGRGTRRAHQRLPKCRLSRSDGRGQGRRKPARVARGTLTACRRGGYPILALGLTQPAARVRFNGGNSTHFDIEIWPTLPLVLIVLFLDFNGPAF